MIKLSLLQLIQGLKEENNPNLKQLEYEFFYRFNGYVYTTAYRCCSKFADQEEFAKDITQVTFINAFKNLSKFSFPTQASEDQYEKIIKAWLGKIANNCFLKEIRHINLFDHLDDSFFLISEDKDLIDDVFEDDYEEVPNEYKNKFAQSWETLKEDERIVLLAYADENCLDGKSYISSETLDELCKYLDTSRSNIRQIKKRAYDKIKKFCFKE